MGWRPIICAECGIAQTTKGGTLCDECRSVISQGITAADKREAEQASLPWSRAVARARYLAEIADGLDRVSKDSDTWTDGERNAFYCVTEVLRARGLKLLKGEQ